MDTIWLLEYNTVRDGYNGWYWDAEISYDRGFYPTEGEAQAAADKANEDSLASIRKLREKSYAESLAIWEKNEAKHKALVAAGLEDGTFRAAKPTLMFTYDETKSLLTNLIRMDEDHYTILAIERA